MKRELIFSPEYIEFEQSSDPRTREKLRYAVSYELRVSVANEVRVILFSADNDNINLASGILLLNGFIKKSTKDYDKKISKAINILRRLL